jgi:hypothetical protein
MYSPTEKNAAMPFLGNRPRRFHFFGFVSVCCCNYVATTSERTALLFFYVSQF